MNFELKYIAPSKPEDANEIAWLAKRLPSMSIGGRR